MEENDGRIDGTLNSRFNTIGDVDMKRLVALLFSLVSFQAFAECKSVPAESFQTFLLKFSESKAYSTARTIYPTYTLRHEYGVEDGKDVSSTVRTAVSKKLDETTPTINQILSKNGMEIKVKEVKREAAIVEIFKPETDWLLSFHYVARRGCWYLHHVEDHSL